MQGITAEYVRFKTGRPILSALRCVQTAPKKGTVRFSVPSEELRFFGFYIRKDVNTRQGCRKAFALTFKEATKHGCTERQKNPYPLEGL